MVLFLKRFATLYIPTHKHILTYMYLLVDSQKGWHLELADAKFECYHQFDFHLGTEVS